MKTLEFCHETDFSKINFIERKVRITHPKTILTGAPRSGKSFLIYDYLSNFKPEDYLYIDFLDIRNDIKEIETNIEEYVFRNNIKVIVLENFEFDFKIPYCDSVIITTKTSKKLKGYKNLSLTPLDFEEFLLHDKKSTNTTNSFNTFLKFGNLPQINQDNEIFAIKRLQELLKLISSNQTSNEILNTLFQNIDEKKSLNQLFTELKMKIKISKDKFYEECKKLEDEKIIFFLKKYNQEKTSKKIYSYNHAFLSAVTHQKKFKNELSNMIFLELLNKYEDIYYLDYIDFYTPDDNCAVICIPFFNSTLMQSQLRKIKKSAIDNKIKDLTIVTVSNNETFLLDDLRVDVLPFYEWALG